MPLRKRQVAPGIVSGGKGEIVIYRGTKGAPALEVRLEGNTLWLTEKQIAMLFGTERSVITKHLGNVFRDGELERKSVCAKFAHGGIPGLPYLFPPMTAIADEITTDPTSLRAPPTRHTRLTLGRSRPAIPAWRGGVAADRIPLWQPVR